MIKCLVRESSRDFGISKEAQITGSSGWVKFAELIEAKKGYKILSFFLTENKKCKLKDQFLENYFIMKIQVKCDDLDRDKQMHVRMLINISI